MSKNNRGFVPILIILAAIVGFLVAGAVVFKNKINNLINPAATPTPNSTSTWKSYSNTQYQFSFKYPSNLKTENIHTSSPYNPDVIFGLELSETSNVARYTFTVLKTNETSVDNWINKNFGNSIPPAKNIDSRSVYQLNNLTISRLESTGSRVVELIFLKDSKIYQLGVLTATQNPKDAENIGNQILSTFKLNQ